jgi:hypothetical protein
VDLGAIGDGVRRGERGCWRGGKGSEEGREKGDSADYEVALKVHPFPLPLVMYKKIFHYSKGSISSRHLL